MQTSANGGDSHVWVQDKQVHIGPRRAIPLCVAAEIYPGFNRTLRRNRILSRKLMGENYQPTKFFVRTEYSPNGLSEEESEVLSRIDFEPVSIKGGDHDDIITVAEFVAYHALAGVSGWPEDMGGSSSGDDAPLAIHGACVLDRDGQPAVRKPVVAVRQVAVKQAQVAKAKDKCQLAGIKLHRRST
jgi:hypothetical protein